MKFFLELNARQRKNLIRIAGAVFFIGIGALINNTIVKNIFLIGAYILIGYDVIMKAAKGIKKKQPFDENFLMSAASAGALLSGELMEGTAVMLFYQIGESFESIAVGKSRKNISGLMDIRPDYANIIDGNGRVIKTDPEEIEIGTEILIFPGEKVPIDGIITDGAGTVNTSALTGESKPEEVMPGTEILSGTINVSSVLKIKTTKYFCDSTASKILDLVENASSRKSRSEDFISKFARIYTPLVCFSAVALAFIPPLMNILLGEMPLWNQWIYRALSFLVISCPCALVVSVPLTFFAVLGGAGSTGILIKGSNYIEPLSKTKCVVMDKTGTLTEGSFEVSKIYSENISSSDLLKFAASAEWGSNHPIGLSIKKAYAEQPDISEVRNLKEISGEGVIAEISGKMVACGNEKLMKRLGVSCVPCTEEGTAVYIAIEQCYSGTILISDIIKPTSSKAIEDLKKAGVSKIVMLTGDRKSTAEAVAKQLNINHVYPNLLPGDKVRIIEELICEKEKEDIVVFVGDGINDSPVIARADVGISMGTIGSDAAIEASDVVIMDDDPRKVAKAIRIAKKCMRIVYENIWFAIGIKVLCLLLCAFGITGMWMAVFADTGVLILAILNAVRALRVKNV